MAKSFLPTIFEHPYEIDPKYGKSVAYFSMEYAIDNSFKIYSGGLGTTRSWKTITSNSSFTSAAPPSG